jgi:hypothetical protein
MTTGTPELAEVLLQLISEPLSLAAPVGHGAEGLTERESGYDKFQQALLCAQENCLG